MSDRETWLILAKRLEQIRREREKGNEPEMTLTFDANDQAKAVPATGQPRRRVVGSTVVPGPDG